jgi:hypothetical protein
MDRWHLIRKRIGDYLGERSSAKERSYRARRVALAQELGMADVSLKGFLPAKTPKSHKSKSGTLGLDKMQKLLSKREFQDLRRFFPELNGSAAKPPTNSYLQLELDFIGFDVPARRRIVRLPIGKTGRVRIRIAKIA